MTDTWRPKPLLAGVLNLLCAGLGNLYSGNLIGAFVVPVALVLWGLGLLYLSCFVDARGMHLALAAVALASQLIAVPLVGFIGARRAVPAPKRWYQRWYALVAFYAVSIVAGRPLVLGTVRLFQLGLYRVPTLGMVPTLLQND